MKILLISDGHGAVDKLSMLTATASTVDCIFFAGDFAAFNKPETGLPFLKELKRLHNNIYSVLGNCDHPSFVNELESHNINVQAYAQQFQEFVIIGSGGASKFTGSTPNERTDSELVDDITNNYIKKNYDNLLLITHNPPYGVKTDKVAPLVHVGSKLIRKFVEDSKPIMILSGHIHEAYGSDNIGKTIVVNPGALCDGRYAIAEISKEQGEYKVQITFKML